MYNVNLFRLIFCTILFFVMLSTTFAIWDYARCKGPVERCDNKAEEVRNGLLFFLPVLFSWIAPSRNKHKESSDVNVFNPDIQPGQPPTKPIDTPTPEIKD